MRSSQRVLRGLCAGLVALAPILAAPGVHAQAWSTRAPLLEAIQEVAVEALDGRLVLVGGLVGFTVSDRVEVYDPAADAWSFAAPLPIPLHHTTATAVSGKLYVIGGWSDFFATPLGRVFEYDPATDTWVEKASMPTPRGSPAAAAVDGKIYVAGGNPATTNFEAYDPATDTWQVLAPMPTGRQHLGAAGVAGQFIAVGGRTSLGAGQDNVATVESYDPATNSWAPLPPLPRARSGLAVTSVGRFVLAFGGEGNAEHADGVFPDTDAFDTQAGAWISLSDMPTPRHGIGAATLEGLVHVPGGGPTEGFGLSDVHEVYDPSVELDLAPAVPALGAAARLTLAALLAALAAGRVAAGVRTPRSSRA